MRLERHSRVKWCALLAAACGVGAIALAALSCATKRSDVAATATVFSDILFSASGLEDANRDGNIATAEWRRKIMFKPHEPLYLVIDDPQASRTVRLKLVGSNGREYDLPQPIRTVKNGYLPVGWELASEARDLMGAEIIMAELYDERTGGLIGACTFSVE